MPQMQIAMSGDAPNLGLGLRVRHGLSTEGAKTLVQGHVVLF